jgi:hypothetical protein
LSNCCNIFENVVNIFGTNILLDQHFEASSPVTAVTVRQLGTAARGVAAEARGIMAGRGSTRESHNNAYGQAAVKHGRSRRPWRHRSEGRTDQR